MLEEDGYFKQMAQKMSDGRWKCDNKILITIFLFIFRHEVVGLLDVEKSGGSSWIARHWPVVVALVMLGRILYFPRTKDNVKVDKQEMQVDMADADIITLYIVWNLTGLSHIKIHFCPEYFGT